jgi:hypothetical protein
MLAYVLVAATKIKNASTQQTSQRIMRVEMPLVVPHRAERAIPCRVALTNTVFKVLFKGLSLLEEHNIGVTKMMRFVLKCYMLVAYTTSPSSHSTFHSSSVDLPILHSCSFQSQMLRNPCTQSLYLRNCATTQSPTHGSKTIPYSRRLLHLKRDRNLPKSGRTYGLCLVRTELCRLRLGAGLAICLQKRLWRSRCSMHI